MAFSVALFLPALCMLLWQCVMTARGRLPLYVAAGRALGGAALYFCFAAFDGAVGVTLAVNGIAALYCAVFGPAGAVLMALLQLLPQ